MKKSKAHLSSIGYLLLVIGLFLCISIAIDINKEGYQDVNSQQIIDLNFNEKVATPLCKIMGRYKSDKGNENIESSHHNYTTLYYHLFKDLQDEPIRLFELGLGTNNVNVLSNMGADGRPGASLYGWADFFPNANIYGADIDRDILFNTDRIKTYYCDQTNKEAIQAMWKEPDLSEPFNIIIDDGLHTFAANVSFFENSIDKLEVGGYYIIEDIRNVDNEAFNNSIKSWKIKYPNLSFKLISIPSSVNKNDNTLLVIKRNQ